MKTENKPFAPFGALLHHLVSLKIKLKYSPFLFCGKYAYEEAKKTWEGGQAALCLPIGHPFDDYSWPIDGLKIILFDTGSMSSLGLSKITYSILKEGATLAAIFSHQKLATDVFKLKKDLQHGLKEGTDKR